jgi:hypothetical protein
MFVLIRIIFIQLTLFSVTLLAQNNDLRIGFDQEYYAGPAEVSMQDQQYTFLNLNNNWEYIKNSHSAKVQFLGQLPLSEGGNIIYAMPEVYYSYGAEMLNNGVPISKQLEFSFGRRIKNWSDLDQAINIGLWQPEVRWDAVRPVQQGLIGIFVDSQLNKKTAISFFISPLFLPDQQPDFDVKDGQIISSNRWFRAPVSQVELNYGSSQIKYQVDKPDLDEVLIQSSYAMMLFYGDKQFGPFIRFSGARKPMNQFHIGIDAQGIYLLDNGDLAPKIKPIVVNHQLLTIETGIRNYDNRLVLSANWENFEDPNLAKSWEQTALVDSQYYGILFSQNLTKLKMPRSQLSFSYVTRNEEKDKNDSTVIEGNVTASTQRLMLKELVSVGIENNWSKSRKRALSTTVAYTYSFDDASEWLTGRVNYQLDSAWGLHLSADIFGTKNENESASSFISQYRSNDRISGGFNYVF